MFRLSAILCFYIERNEQVFSLRINFYLHSRRGWKEIFITFIYRFRIMFYGCKSFMFPLNVIELCSRSFVNLIHNVPLRFCSLYQFDSIFIETVRSFQKIINHIEHIHYIFNQWYSALYAKYVISSQWEIYIYSRTLIVWAKRGLR